MSLLVTNCHGYSATGVTGWPSTATQVWLFGWFKVDGVTAGTHRAIVQITEASLDGTQDYVGLSIDGSNVLTGTASTSNTDAVTPDPGNLYFWNGAQQNKWTVGCTVFDSGASNADLKVIYGRAAATAVAATTQTAATDMTLLDSVMESIFVGRDRRSVVTGSGTTSDATDGIKVAYIAIGHGAVPSQSDIQSCIDGMHPADLSGVWEYWDLTDSGSGLVGAMRSITLAPFGGSATTTWDGADNPTVADPTGGGGGSSLLSKLMQYTH